MLYHNIIKSDEKRVIKKILQEQVKFARNTTWYASVMREIKKYQINIEAEEVLKSAWKKIDLLEEGSIRHDQVEV